MSSIANQYTYTNKQDYKPSWTSWIVNAVLDVPGRSCDDRITEIRPGHTMRWNRPFCCDFDGSRSIADHRRYLPENRSSVASQLGAINCFYFLLWFSSQRSHIELFNRDYWDPHDMTAYGITITIMKTVWKSGSKQQRYSKIRTKILSMFSFLSQHIAHDFEASQHL